MYILQGVIFCNSSNAIIFYLDKCQNPFQNIFQNRFYPAGIGWQIGGRNDQIGALSLRDTGRQMPRDKKHKTQKNKRDYIFDNIFFHFLYLSICAQHSVDRANGH